MKAGEHIVMAPSGVQKERMMPEDMFVLDSHGNVVHSPTPRAATLRPVKLSECAPLFTAVSFLLEALCAGNSKRSSSLVSAAWLATLPMSPAATMPSHQSQHQQQPQCCPAGLRAPWCWCCDAQPLPECSYGDHAGPTSNRVQGHSSGDDQGASTTQAATRFVRVWSLLVSPCA